MGSSNFTITDAVNAQIYGQDREASRARIRQQNAADRRARLGRTQPWFLSEAERDSLVTRLQALRAPTGFDAAYTVNVEPCVRMLTEAALSYRKPGRLVVQLAHHHAVLMGNVLRRLGTDVVGLSRVDEIAGRSNRGGL